MEAGGTVGWLVGQPLFVGITAVPAILLLVLLGLFGLLLILGISVADVPRLIRGGWRELGGSPGRRRRTTSDGQDLGRTTTIRSIRTHRDADAPAAPAVPTPAGGRMPTPGRYRADVLVDIEDDALTRPISGPADARRIRRPSGCRGPARPRRSTPNR